MQKQRSPYTGGSFNLQQLKASNFGKGPSPDSGLNGMPLLMQLVQQAQHVPHVPQQQHHQQQLPPLRSFNKTPMNSFPQSQLPPQSQSMYAAGVERGQRSGTPRTYMNYECHGGGLNDLGSGAYNGCPSDDYSAGLHMGSLERQDQLDDLGSHHSDTDSETEYTEQMKSFDAPPLSRGRQVLDYLKSGMPLQRQQRMESMVQRCSNSGIVNTGIMLLQLFFIVLGSVLWQAMRLRPILTAIKLRLWRCKFQLKSILRQLLWRMANAKGNDALLFLGFMFVTPWVFLISLVGFFISFVFHIKDGVDNTLSQLRFQVLN